MTNNTLPLFIELFGGGQGLLLLIVWLRSPARYGWAGRFLILLLASASALLFWLALHDSRLLVYTPDLIGLGPALPFLLGPLLYGYLRVSALSSFRWRAVYGLHSLPFWLVLLGHLPFYSKPFAEKQAFVLSHYNHAHLDWWGQLPLVHFLIYGLLSWPFLSRYNMMLKTGYSTTEGFRLTWFRQLSLALGAGYGLFILVYVSRGLHPAGSVLALSLTGFVYLVGYRQLRQPALFDAVPVAESAEPIPTGTESTQQRIVPKYQKSSLSADTSRAYARQLTELMTGQSRYRDGRLTLSQVADELGISSHTLSQVLNQTLNVTFYDYVNGYRVEAVKQALVNPKNHYLTILALALDAGFDSKAAFNSAFKKHTGLTPSQYRSQFHFD